MEIKNSKFIFDNPYYQLSEGISIVIPVRYRPQQLENCIKYIIKQNAEPYEIIIVEEIYTEAKGVYVNTFDNSLFPDIRKGFIKTSSKKFNKSRCINFGVEMAEYKHIIMLDVDLIMDKYYLIDIDMLFKFNKGGSILKEVYYLDHFPIEDKFEYSMKWSDLRKYNPHGGTLFFTKDLFYKVGMMNEAFEGHGYEDTDFYERIKDEKNGIYDIRTAEALHMPHKIEWTEEELNKNRHIYVDQRTQDLIDKVNIANKQSKINIIKVI